MPRTLVVDHQEEPSTNPLLTGFLGVAVVWMLLSALSGGFSVTTTNLPSDAPVPVVDPL